MEYYYFKTRLLMSKKYLSEIQRFFLTCFSKKETFEEKKRFGVMHFQAFYNATIKVLSKLITIKFQTFHYLHYLSFVVQMMVDRFLHHLHHRCFHFPCFVLLHPLHFHLPKKFQYCIYPKTSLFRCIIIHKLEK